MARHGVIPEAHGDASLGSGEQELILPRNSKFKVHGVVTVPGAYPGAPDEQLVQIEQLL